MKHCWERTGESVVHHERNGNITQLGYRCRQCHAFIWVDARRKKVVRKDWEKSFLECQDQVVKGVLES